MLGSCEGLASPPAGLNPEAEEAALVTPADRLLRAARVASLVSSSSSSSLRLMMTGPLGCRGGAPCCRCWDGGTSAASPYDWLGGACVYCCSAGAGAWTC